MRAAIATIGVVVLGVVLGGCGSSPETSRAIERVLPRLIGPAANYRVRASGATGSRVQQLHVEADRLAVDSPLVFDTALLDMSDVRYDRNRRELLGIGHADFSTTLLQEDLNDYLRERITTVRNLRIRLTADGARLSGSASLPGVSLPIAPEFTMDGKLSPDEYGRLCFHPDRIRVIGIEVPQVAATLLAAQINPLLDLTGIRLPLILRDVHTEPGELHLQGRARFRTGSTLDASAF